MDYCEEVGPTEVVNMSGGPEYVLTREQASKLIEDEDGA